MMAGTHILRRRRVVRGVDVLFVGHSHVTALQMAHAQAPEPRTMAANFLQLGTKQYSASTEADDLLGHAARRAIAASRADVVACAVFGNEHNILGLLNHPRRFDFVLPEREDLPLDHTAELLPSGLVRSVLGRLVAPGRLLLAAIQARARHRLIYLEPPPPIPAAEHIRQYPGVFEFKIGELGVAPAALRYKLWRVNSALYRDICSELGVAFVPVPPAAQDARGMMVPEAWNLDPTHGNAWYGARRLEQLQGLLR